MTIEIEETINSVKMPKVKRESRQFIVINEEKLISEVEKRSILYDKALKGYRKPAIRETAWQDVATALESTGNFFYSALINAINSFDLFLI